MSIEDVIFLGAGASHADGAPLQGQLLAQGQQVIQANEELRTFFYDFFEFNSDNGKEAGAYPTFEEIFGILELAISRNESIRGYPLNSEDPKIQKIREKIILCIAQILDQALQSGRTNHNTLVQRLAFEGKLESTAFVSLNYDILVDNALTDLHNKAHLDYGIPFTNFNDERSWHKPDENKSVKLYKLHGSLNWLYCPTCIAIRITPGVKSVSMIEHHPENCSKCKTTLTPIIIPPTFFKIMSNHFLQQIWNKTENILMEAKRFIFCGYSFPDADIHIKYLLKRVEVNRGTTPDIFICNFYDNKSKEESGIEKNRYKRFFRVSDKVNYEEISFEKFCESGIVDKK